MSSKPQHPRWFLLLFPFMQWVSILDKVKIKADISAGIIAGVLILPQAIALATLSGMPPEYGFYTAIFPVIIVGLYGSSWHALAGPNTAVALLTITILQTYASPFTPDYIAYVITLTFMVGVVQIVLGLLRLGAVFNYFSHTVMVGLVSGVGLIIIIQQLGPFLGLLVNVGEPLEDTLYQLAHSLYLTNGYEAVVGFSTILTVFLVKRYSKFPPLIAAVIVGMSTGFFIDTLFGSSNAGIDKLGYMSLSLAPFSAPDFSQENFAVAEQGLLVGSFSIAFLALMQSAVIARSLATRSGQQIDLNQEIIGHGLSNVGGSFLSCFTSCGSFNRSAANIDAGAATPLTGIISAFVLLGLIYFASDIVAFLPISAMAGILIVVGWGLIDIGDIKQALKSKLSTRAIFLSTLFTTVYGGVQFGVFLGMFLSVVSYLNAVSKPEIKRIEGDDRKAYYPPLIKQASVIKAMGNLFFASIPELEKQLSQLSEIDHHQQHLIIVAKDVHHLDASGIKVLKQEAKRRQKQQKKLFILSSHEKLNKTLKSYHCQEVDQTYDLYFFVWPKLT
ncbi:SulP family inorganic anion transporter [Magnetococcales bacterium HHB-1]